LNRRAFGFEITLAQVGPVHDPAFRAAPDSVKERVKGWIVTVGLEEKDADLAAGLDASGQALAPLEPETRSHRVSAEGAADPSAPPLMPAREHSRTRYLLQGETTETGAQFWWGYDPASHSDWGQVLDYHRRGIGRKHRVVRDVIGISEAALGRVRRRVMDLWTQYRREETRTPDSPRRDSLRAGGARILQGLASERETVGLLGAVLSPQTTLPTVTLLPKRVAELFDASRFAFETGVSLTTVGVQTIGDEQPAVVPLSQKPLAGGAAPTVPPARTIRVGRNGEEQIEYGVGNGTIADRKVKPDTPKPVKLELYRPRAGTPMGQASRNAAARSGENRSALGNRPGSLADKRGVAGVKPSPTLTANPGTYTRNIDGLNENELLDLAADSATRAGSPVLRTRAAKELADELRVMAAQVEGFDRGIRTGSKAVINGSLTAVRVTLTASFVDGHWEVVEVTPEDREIGYDQAANIATVSADLLISAISEGASLQAVYGGRIVKAIHRGFLILDKANDVAGVVRGGADILENGPTEESIKFLIEGMATSGRGLSQRQKNRSLSLLPNLPGSASQSAGGGNRDVPALTPSVGTPPNPFSNVNRARPGLISEQPKGLSKGKSDPEPSVQVQNATGPAGVAVGGKSTGELAPAGPLETRAWRDAEAIGQQTGRGRLEYMKGRSPTAPDSEVSLTGDGRKPVGPQDNRPPSEPSKTSVSPDRRRQSNPPDQSPPPPPPPPPSLPPPPPQLALPHEPTTERFEQIFRITDWKERAEAGELHIHEIHGGQRQVHFNVPVGGEITGTGGRYVDVLVPLPGGGNLAIEVKTYLTWYTDKDGVRHRNFVGLRRDIAQQVLKDAYLRDTLPNHRPHWVFLGAPPDDELADFLRRHRIEFVVHEVRTVKRQ